MVRNGPHKGVLVQGDVSTGTIPIPASRGQCAKPSHRRPTQKHTEQYQTEPDWGFEPCLYPRSRLPDPYKCFVSLHLHIGDIWIVMVLTHGDGMKLERANVCISLMSVT